MMKKYMSYFLLLSILNSCGKNADDTTNPARDGVYINGYFGTGTISNSGVVAPAGYNWSELQHNTGGNVTNSFTGTLCSRSGPGNYHIADDFTIPAGQTWKISKFSIYASASASGPGSPFDSLRIQVWNRKPTDAGASVIFGNLVSNVLSSSIDSLTYVIENSTVPAPGITPYFSNSTRIWKLSANVDVTLQPGTYWLDWQAHSPTGICSSTPVKTRGSRGLPGWNALVFNGYNMWEEVADPGRPYISPNPGFVKQDFPFEIVYKY